LNFNSLQLPGTFSNRTDSNLLYVDCIFFQLNSTGIAKLWTEVLRVWSRNNREQIVLICRGGFVPDFGFRRIFIPPFSFQEIDSGIQGLTWILLRECARNVLSTYYTYSELLPVRAVVYDMIPEELGWSGPVHCLKTRYLQRAVCSHSISQTTKNKLLLRHPHLEGSSVHHLAGISEVFSPATHEERAVTRERIGVTRKFLFVLPCPLEGYKNGFIALQALEMLNIASQSEVIVTAGSDQSSVVTNFFPTLRVRFLRFTSDFEYSRVVASCNLLLWPSLTEGMGLPPIEAVASGVQAVCVLNDINLEIFGPDAVYSSGTDPAEFASAIVRALGSPLNNGLVSRVSQLRSYEGYAESLLNFGLSGASHC